MKFSNSELDSYAIIVVLGKNTFIVESIDITCNIEPFVPELEIAQNLPIVDAVIAYDCEYNNETHIRLIRNAMHILLMHHNLLPPFIKRHRLSKSLLHYPKLVCSCSFDYSAVFVNNRQ